MTSFRTTARVPFVALLALALSFGALTAVTSPTPAQAAVTSCTPTAGYNNCVTYTYSGGNQTFTVPSGVTEIRATIDGGGEARIGTRGGRTVGSVAVTPGATLNVTVGQQGGGTGSGYTFGGGAPGGRVNCVYCGQQGGGMSALWNGTPFTTDAALLIAGGAGGDSSGARAGGAGGGLSGNDGAGANTTINGKGGDQTAGGAAGVGGRFSTSGTQFQGGTGGRGLSGNSGGGGGGGGGGWFGGGGGGWGSASTNTSGGGGGAGSGYIDGPGVTDATTTVGGGASGNHGVVTIQYLAPTVTLDPVASPTSEAVQQLSGTGVPGNDVVVTLQPGDVVLCETTVLPDGTWSCDTTPVADGVWDLEVVQSDPTRPDVTYGSASRELIVDTTAPAAPVIDNPADGTITNNPLPSFGGTGEVGTTVTVRDENDAAICTAVVEDDGTWTCDPATPFGDGSKTFTATQVDAVGLTSPASDPVAVTFFISLPDPPVILTPADASYFTERSPLISGTGTPGDVVAVADSLGATVCSVEVEDDGTWECAPATPLADGRYSISATQTDPTGDSSAQSAVVSFVVDNVAPAAPTITQPTNGLVTNDSTPVFRGIGEPGAVITVVDENGAVVCTAAVPSLPIASGSWTCESAISFPDGDKTFTATQVDRAGNTSPASAPVNVTILVALPAPPVIVDPTDDLVTNQPLVPISGTGTPGYDVTVFDTDGSEVCAATVQPDGTWSCAPSTGFADGVHTVTAVQTDPAGDASPASNAVTVTVDTVAPMAPIITRPADGGTAVGSRPEFAGTGEAGSSIVIIDENGDELCSTTVGVDGTWSCTPTRDLIGGERAATVISTDRAGNSSTTDVTFTLVPPINPGDPGGGGGAGSGAGTGDLAQTGGTLPGTFLALGASALLAGMLLLTLRRRLPQK